MTRAQLELGLADGGERWMIEVIGRWKYCDQRPEPRKREIMEEIQAQSRERKREARRYAPGRVGQR